MKLTPLERELEGEKTNSVACEESYVTPERTTRSTTVDMTVKWQLNLRKYSVCLSSIP
jgi:hypothetical protein